MSYIQTPQQLPVKHTFSVYKFETCYLSVLLQDYKSNQSKLITMPNNNFSSSQDTGVTGAAKFVTSTLGNTVGGVSRTVGGVTGAAARGVGDTITSATGSAGKPVGDALGSVGTGVEDGANRVAKGVEDAGQWR